MTSYQIISSYLYPLLFSAVCGSLIGLEREYWRKPAGLRTCALVCLGACLFSLLSSAVPASFIDRGHIAANVVQGIGLLAAGAILTYQNKVTGLTTASMIWVVAAIGVACGFSLYILAFVTTCVALLIVLGAGLLEKKFIRNKISKKVV